MNSLQCRLNNSTRRRHCHCQTPQIFYCSSDGVLSILSASASTDHPRPSPNTKKARAGRCSSAPVGVCSGSGLGTQPLSAGPLLNHFLDARTLVEGALRMCLPMKFWLGPSLVKPVHFVAVRQGDGRDGRLVPARISVIGLKDG